MYDGDLPALYQNAAPSRERRRRRGATGQIERESLGVTSLTTGYQRTTPTLARLTLEASPVAVAAPCPVIESYHDAL